MTITIMGVTVRHAFLATVLCIATGCSDPTLEIVNTSGTPQEVTVSDGRSQYWQDTVAAGEERCWRIPDVAQKHAVAIAATNPALAQQSFDFTVAWIVGAPLQMSPAGELGR